jgi:hypothetical protein
LQNNIFYKKIYQTVAILAIIIACIAPGSIAYADGILKTEKLDKETEELTINRDIFSPDTMKPRSLNDNLQRRLPPPPPPKVEPPKPKPQVGSDIEDEIRRSLFYEGYVIKKPNNFALISSNGEFFAVGVGDIILERIKILTIDKEIITVEVDSRKIEIQLKGDDSDDQ